MKHLIDMLWQQIGGAIGLAANVTGILSVYYAVKNRIATWPWSIVSVILYGKIFLDSKDPSNAALQVLYYLPISIYGWYIWLRGGPKHNDDLPVTTLKNNHLLIWIASTAVVCVIWGRLEMKIKPDADMPYWDAATTAISITAQYLQTRKRFENWYFWIFVDVIFAFYMLPKQHQYGLAAVYFLFLIMAFQGAFVWRKILKTQEQGNLSASESSV